jgi:hypothetical protein
VHLVGSFMAQAAATRAIDATAEFPRPPAADVPAVFARIGETLRRWFGFGQESPR